MTLGHRASGRRKQADTPDYRRPDQPEDGRQAIKIELARKLGLVPVITRAIDHPGYAVRAPVTLSVGVLVVLALQTEVKLTRNPQGRWTLTVHKHPMRDSALGQVISKLRFVSIPT